MTHMYKEDGMVLLMIFIFAMIVGAGMAQIIPGDILLLVLCGLFILTIGYVVYTQKVGRKHSTRQ